MRLALVIAHRGASRHHPENTVAAFRGAVAFGAAGVELDVRHTVDGALAVLHDPVLPDGRPVAEVPASELPEGVCLLADALAACGDLLVNVEIKADGPGGGLPLVEPTLAAIAGWGGRVIVSSFDPATVDAVGAADPSLPLAQLTLLLSRPALEVVAAIADRGLQAWHPWHPTVEAEAVAAAKAAGLLVNAWTIDDPERMRLLTSWGVDGIVTNDVPGALAALG